MRFLEAHMLLVPINSSGLQVLIQLKILFSENCIFWPQNAFGSFFRQQAAFKMNANTGTSSASITNKQLSLTLKELHLPMSRDTFSP